MSHMAASGDHGEPRPAILVIEDDPDARRLLRDLLTEAGYAVREAPDGAAGLAEVARDVPALVLVDLNLPRIGGWEVCRQLKRDGRTRLLPVLMMTAAYVSPQDARYGLALGADEYIEKPFVPEVLLHNIERLLGRGEPAIG